jgi:PPOX class probable F420-dependent enzyme
MSTRSGGRVHSVPVCFAIVGDEIVSPIDHKPKSGVKMARVTNIERNNNVTLLLDRWDEDWDRLAWLMIQGTAVVDLDAPHEDMQAINQRYPQYWSDEHHDALIRIKPQRFVWWSWT